MTSMRNENFEFMQETPWPGYRQVWSEEGEHPRCILLQSRLRSSKDNTPMPGENFIISEFGNLILILEKTDPPFAKGTGVVITKIKNIGGAKIRFLALLRPWQKWKEHYYLEIPGSEYNQPL